MLDESVMLAMRFRKAGEPCSWVVASGELPHLQQPHLNGAGYMVAVLMDRPFVSWFRHQYSCDNAVLASANILEREEGAVFDGFTAEVGLVLPPEIGQAGQRHWSMRVREQLNKQFPSFRSVGLPLPLEWISFENVD